MLYKNDFSEAFQNFHGSYNSNYKYLGYDLE